jgi:heptosyltransferase III
MTRVLAVRLDNVGDVLVTGPALRAMANSADWVDMLVSPAGRPAATMLPGVAEILTFDPPWSGYHPPRVDDAAIAGLVDRLRRRSYDRALIFTSFHQSPLPMAMLARMAGIGWLGATSEDYPGSLLDLRHRRDGGHEVDAALALARAAGFRLPPADDGRLAVRRPLPDVGELLPDGPFVVVHPGASVPARGLLPEHARAIVRGLVSRGWHVVVTGTAGDAGLVAAATPRRARGLAGRTDLSALAALIDRAACVVVGNTGPAHLAAAVGTPVVSLFAPVVPAERWAPYGVPHAVLGDQQAPCRDTRARACPVPGHPCVSDVSPDVVATVVERLVDRAGPPEAAAGTAAYPAMTSRAVSAS